MKNHLFTLVAILLGLMLVVVAILFRPSSGATVVSNDDNSFPLNRVTDRHLYGSNRAPVTIVEFSDVECPFCSRVHPTLKQIVDDSRGEISWEYRHLPLPNHRNAQLGAIASECVWELSSNDTFWEYLDILFANQREHSEDFYVNTASELGIGTDEFSSCIKSNDRLQELVELDRQTALAFGGRGTPFSVIQYADGTIKTVAGALPYDQWMVLLEK